MTSVGQSGVSAYKYRVVEKRPDEWPESGWGEYGPLKLGAVWQRTPPGRERVRVHRLWNYLGEGPTVRAHPIRGGRPLVADAHWFIEHYVEVPDA